MKPKTFCFDIDGTICITKKGNYKESAPIKKNIKAVNELYNSGNKIIFFTSRFMTKLKRKDIKIKGYLFTKKQLDSWGVKFHKLYMLKPEYDYIIDDKSIFYKKNWSDSINKSS
tara:strand:+ start:380 stop:721 length:342 start_codon:yes stop_codon:yes gene_type:complete